MSDLLAHSQRKTKMLALACGSAVVVGAGWALMPASTPMTQAPSLAIAGGDAPETPLAPLDVKAFNTPVWTIAAAPQPPAPPPLPPPAPPPLKLQLIGILKEAEVYKAVLYDPDSNKVFVVASGEEAMGHRIDRVVADAVTLKDGPLVRTLALKTGGGV